MILNSEKKCVNSLNPHVLSDFYVTDIGTPPPAPPPKKKAILKTYFKKGGKKKERNRYKKRVYLTFCQSMRQTI